MYKITEILKRIIQRIKVSPHQFCIRTSIGHDDYFLSGNINKMI